jgi:hypothetical protein
MKKSNNWNKKTKKEIRYQDMLNNIAPKKKRYSKEVKIYGDNTQRTRLESNKLE